MILKRTNASELRFPKSRSAWLVLQKKSIGLNSGVFEIRTYNFSQDIVQSYLDLCFAIFLHLFSSPFFKKPMYCNFMSKVKTNKSTANCDREFDQIENAVLCISNGMPFGGGSSSKNSAKTTASIDAGADALNETKTNMNNKDYPVNPSNSPQGGHCKTRIIRIKEVIARIGLSRSSIYNLIAIGNFPRKIALGERAIGFFEHEIEHWMLQRRGV